MPDVTELAKTGGPSRFVLGAVREDIEARIKELFPNDTIGNVPASPPEPVPGNVGFKTLWARKLLIDARRKWVGADA